MNLDSFARTAARAALGLLVVLAALGPASAIERGTYSLEVLVDGVPLEEYAARGKTYVEALEGRDYSLRLTNRTPRRIAVALAVDGLNTIDAKKTTAAEASKWILGPYETLTLDGWQTGQATARRFYFTTEDRSYGAWLGQTSDLGVISAAVFRERRPKPVPIQRAPGRRSSEMRDESAAGERERRSMGKAEEPRLEAQAPPLDDDLAATGIGREIDHRVRRIVFDAEPSPAAVMTLRYEYRDALVRLGVFPRPLARRDDPLARRERARGFDGFAPDPFRRP